MSSSPYTSRAFWVSTAERATKTFAQTLSVDVAARVTVAASAGHYPLTWWGSAIGVAGPTVLSVLSSVGSAKIGPDNTPSLVGEPPVP